MIGGASGIGFGLGLSIGKAGSRKGKTQVKPYIEPEVLESLCGLWVADGKKNSDLDNSIVKNKIKNRGGDFEIHNASFTTGNGYENGAFITNGRNNVIQSQDNVKTMIDGSRTFTIVSMVFNISTTTGIFYSNNIGDDVNYFRNIINKNNDDKLGIYGYAVNWDNADEDRLINGILGDEEDYTFRRNSGGSFGVIRINAMLNSLGASLWTSKVAWYWTFLSDMMLTDDQIHQIIRYFNLDKYVEPQLYYDVKKQGLTNENHAEFDDKLINLTGNGWNLQLYNFAWSNDGSSGITRYGGLYFGRDDYGYMMKASILKDYSIIAKRVLSDDRTTPWVKKDGNGAFALEFNNKTQSFGYENSCQYPDGFLTYCSKYKYNGQNILAGDRIDTEYFKLGNDGIVESGYFIELYWFLLFPYSLSEFLMRRQLERLKLTNPDEVEWRTKIIIADDYPRDNIDIHFYKIDGYGNIVYELVNGQYYDKYEITNHDGYIGVEISIQDENDEIAKLLLNGEVQTTRPDGGVFYIKPRIDVQYVYIRVDEYIRFEDIAQPYPAYFQALSTSGINPQTFHFGDKIKVGTKCKPVSYTCPTSLFKYPSTTLLFNESSYTSNITITKGENRFSLSEPAVCKYGDVKSILMPFYGNMPIESIKYLGYIPDISGNGNHGYLHNFDLNTQLDENGVLHFDGVDDYIDFPTMPEGGKQVFMKCKTINWGSTSALYDQRASNNTDKFGIIIDQSSAAYNYRNSGNTFIDGVLNEYITALDLANVTHNIVATNTLEGSNNETTTPVIGSYYAHDNYFTNMDLYSFMLFDEISSDGNIVRLNEAVGIEGNYVESPSWYWDISGKTNEDADRATIANKGLSVGDYDLSVINVAYDGGSGYSNNSLVLDGVDDYITNANIPVLTDYTYIFKRDIINHDTNINALSMVKGSKPAPSKRAFIADLTNSVTNENSYYSFGARLINNAAKDMNVVYATKTSVNGISITPGQNTDAEGIEIAKWDSYKNMAFQKLMLYPTTIDNLSINMLRNMFEFDYEIDMRSSIFKPYHEYSSIPDFSLFVPRIDVTAILLPDSITITHINGFGPTYLEIKQPIQFLFKPFTVNVEGLTDDVTLCYIYHDNNNNIYDFELINGENEISYHPEGFAPEGFAVLCYEESLDCNIKITLIK